MSVEFRVHSVTKCTLIVDSVSQNVHVSLAPLNHHCIQIHNNNSGKYCCPLLRFTHLSLLSNLTRVWELSS